MSAPATGYFRPGESWLHRRNPVTKLLALIWMILTAFLLPPPALVGLVAGLASRPHPPGCCGRWSGACASRPSSSPRSWSSTPLLPGARDVVGGSARWPISREGLTFGAISAGRLLVAFSASILFLFTTLADDLLEALVARGASHRIAFVILSAVQMVPRLQSRAAAILEAQQARGLEIGGSLARRARALVPLVDRSCSDRSSTSASERSPSRRARSGRGRPDGLSARARSAGRPLAALADRGCGGRGRGRWRSRGRSDERGHRPRGSAA